MLESDEAGVGLRALFSMPNGVEEAVIDVIVGGSETERIEGIRGTLGESGICSIEFPDVEDATESPEEVGLRAKSTESSGALGGVLD